jgi:hypothetical protein
MPIFDIFSKREKRLNKKVSDVFIYDSFPNPFRVQVIHIIKNLVDPAKPYVDEQIYKPIHEILCREYGVFLLTRNANTNFDSLFEFFLRTENPKEVLDVIETSLRIIGAYAKHQIIDYRYVRISNFDEAIDELNYRFFEHELGYQYESGTIKRIDSQYIHSEATLPALEVLNEEKFKGANEEFRKAHEHYRHARYGECLSECLKAFESTMKSICENQNWEYDKKDTAKTLIDVCIKNKLFPEFLLAQYTSLRSTLESGIPTVRNKLSGHGQGTETIVIPQYFAAYQLHLTASTILFLTDAEKNLQNINSTRRPR